MITEIIISAFFTVVNGVLSIIPATPAIPSGMISAINSIFSLISTVGYFFPLGTFGSVLIIMFAVYNIKVLMDVVSWILKKIPTMAG